MMSKWVLIILVTVLTGCASVKVPQTDIDKLIAAYPTAAAAPDPASPPPPYPVSTVAMAVAPPAPVIDPEPAPSIPSPAPKKKQSRAMAVAQTVVESVVTAAKAATKAEVTTTVYDDAGKVKGKTVVENDESVLADLVKLVGLLTGTLGLYVGWKNFRKPAAVAQKA